MRLTLALALIAGCTTGKISIDDSAPDTDVGAAGHADTDPPNDSDSGLVDTDSDVVPEDTDLLNDHKSARDDDGDCYCEIGPCSGSIAARCLTLRDSDCDDSRADVFPGAVEACNGRDDNCNGDVDEAGATGGTMFFRDSDGDGYGAPGSGLVACTAPLGTAANAEDCYDSNADAHPSAPNWHTGDRGDGSYDYDCDRNTTQQYADSYQCRVDCAWGLVEGWTSQVPACGDSGPWGTGCQWSGIIILPAMPGCAPTASLQSVQGCR